MKRISIVIPVFNKFKFTDNCLKDLSHLSDVEIIVVDNGSTDETESQLENNSNIVYYRSSHNGGFAYACNVGYCLSTSDKVLFLNNDIAVRSNKENWIDIIIDACEGYNGLVGPTMGQLNSSLNFVQEQDSCLDGISYMSGWCLAATKEVWSKLHTPRTNPHPVDSSFHWQIFSEEYFAYFEDTSLSLKARQLDIPFTVVSVPVVHFKRQTSSQLNTSQLYTQSREKFLKNWKNKIKLLKFD